MLDIHSFALNFRSDMQGKININVPHADNTLNEATVRQAMTDMITIGIIMTTAGKPSAIESAELITVSRESLI